MHEKVLGVAKRNSYIRDEEEDADDPEGGGGVGAGTGPKSTSWIRLVSK